MKHEDRTQGKESEAKQDERELTLAELERVAGGLSRPRRPFPQGADTTNA